MSRKKKELSPARKAYETFSKDHYVTMQSYSGCEFGDHVDIECTCGWSVTDFGSATCIVQHVLEVVYESSTV